MKMSVAAQVLSQRVASTMNFLAPQRFRLLDRNTLKHEYYFSVALPSIPVGFGDERDRTMSYIHDIIGQTKTFGVESVKISNVDTFADDAMLIRTFPSQNETIWTEAIFGRDAHVRNIQPVTEMTPTFARLPKISDEIYAELLPDDPQMPKKLTREML